MEFLSWVRDQWDRVGAVVLVVVGALALLLGWLGISDAVLPSEQLPYLLSGGLLGVFLLGLGTTLWLSADLRDEWRKLDVIDENLRRLAGDRAPEEGQMISLSDDVTSNLPHPAGARQ